MQIPWLDAKTPQFPDPALAADEPNGLVAAGGGLSCDWLLAAYSRGIFPWFDDDQGPILWWSPDPRAVIAPIDIRVSRSLRKTLRRADFHIDIDQNFAAVIEACAAPRAYTNQTWITADMQSAYSALFDEGYAHCVEVYADGQLVGGLYGVCLGQMFFGESMFSRQTDASKIAFVALGRHLAAWQCQWIDCQMMTGHLESLGVTPLPRHAFLERVAENRQYPTRRGPWGWDATHWEFG